jgi:hypothetical protein
MRIQQQQPLPQHTQRPILMGMQPQASGPGKVIQFFFVLVVLSLDLLKLMHIIPVIARLLRGFVY